MQNDELLALIERYERASFSVTKKFNAMTRDRLRDDLTQEQFSVLRFISFRGTCTSSELADAFCVGKSAITPLIAKLEEKKLIRRATVPGDRRVHELALTPLGEQQLQEAVQAIQDWIGGYLKHFSQEEIEAFIHSFEKLAALINEDKGSAEA